MSIKGQGLSLTLVNGHSDFKVKCLTLACVLRWAIHGLMALLISETIESFGTKFLIKAYEWMGMKIYTNESVHMTKMAAMPILYMVKKEKKNHFENQKVYNLENCYVALCTWMLPRLFKFWRWVDLLLFYTKVKFGHICFCMGKSENYIFGNCCSHRPQSWLKYSNKWVNEVNEY